MEQILEIYNSQRYLLIREGKVESLNRTEVVDCKMQRDIIEDRILLLDSKGYGSYIDFLIELHACCIYFMMHSDKDNVNRSLIDAMIEDVSKYADANIKGDNKNE